MTIRERMDYDVVIVGAGPSGLSAGIRLKQLAQMAQRDINVCIIEKGSEVGAHILSGAVLEPRALNELIPDWQALDAPLNTPVTKDQFFFLRAHNAIKLPTPPQMRNHGNYIISLGNLCRWLAKYAENIGVDIYSGFAATEIIYDAVGKVSGVATGDMGIGKNGEKTNRYQPGIELYAKQTIFAEGCRGSLTKELFSRFELRKNLSPQTYGIGLKELWEIEPSYHQRGLVLHTIGWPLDRQTYGGSFLYHLEDNQVAVGFVVGLDYRNPYMDPYWEFQTFKTHPLIRPIFESGRRISYGARAISEGGFQSIPKLTFPGGLLVGDTAGFLNVPKIKGTHTAMKSGMLAAEAVFEHFHTNSSEAEIKTYETKVKSSWIYNELYRVRNIRPAFRWGLFSGLAYSAIDTFLLKGHAPWTLNNRSDHTQLQKAPDSKQISYAKPDGVVSFDRLSSVFISNTNHEEDQPSHLQLIDSHIPVNVNLPEYAGPEQRYCPAGVYEFIHEGNSPRLQINAQNCVHCKTCDIKDPSQNINWTAPEGGGGPNYPNM